MKRKIRTSKTRKRVKKKTRFRGGRSRNAALSKTK